MPTDNQLTQSIMRRVYAIYILRRLLSPPAIKLYILAIFAGSLVRQVSLDNILANAGQTSGLFGFLNFWLTALAHTETLIQLAIALIVIILCFLLRDIYRNLASVTSAVPAK